MDGYKKVRNMENRRRNKVLILIVTLLILTSCLGISYADDWTQTTQSDFDGGTKTFVDIISDPGNVTLSQLWIKYPLNPVLDVGAFGSWEENYVWAPSVLYNGTAYQMWYTGDDVATYGRIGYATSPDGVTWTKYGGNPVLDLGPPDSWDDANLDYVAVLFNGTGYQMWYSGDDGLIINIGYATSPDGITWTKYPSNPVLTIGISGSWDDYSVWQPTVVFDGLTFHMWYLGTDGSTNRIGYATSPDGIVWTKNPANPVFVQGTPGSWDGNGISAPEVFYDGMMFFMWYSGDDGFKERTGYATSTDGISWMRSSANPVLDVGTPGSWDDDWAAFPSIVYNGTRYQMWYTGYDGSTRRIGHATMSHQLKGNLTSSVFDSGVSGTTWNFINWTEYLPPDTNITMAIRSGDTSVPDSSWSQWSLEMWDEMGSAIISSRTRYIQYRATLTTANQNLTPILSEVNINYTPNTAQQPTLTAPQNDTYTADNTPIFRWTFSDSEGDLQTGYTVQLDDDPSFVVIDYTSGIVTSINPWWNPSFPIADGLWYWRARVKDSYDLWSDYSDYWVIKIDTTPPSIDDITEGPDPQGLNEFVNISAYITDNFGVDEAWININGVGEFSMEYDPINGRYYWNQTYGLLGTYTFTIYANDTMDNLASDTGSFLIKTEVVPPSISDVSAIPDPQEVYGNVNISATITDNVIVLGAWVDVFDPDGNFVDHYSLMYDSFFGRYYWNQTYDLLGDYVFTIYANDSTDNWETVFGNFTIQDSTPPLISEIAEIPDPQEVFETVNISANVTDNYQLFGVWLEISDGDGNRLINISMPYDSVNEKYFWNHTYDIVGTYSYTIWANDTIDNWASVSGSFTIYPTIPPIITNVTAEPYPQTVKEEVIISARVTDEDTALEDLTVRVSISHPNGTSLGNFTMIYNSTSGKFTYSSSFDFTGTYNFTIWVNDQDDNWAWEEGSFDMVPKSEPDEYNWKPIIAMIFALVLLILGFWVSNKWPMKFTGELEKDRWYTLIYWVLPFVAAELITGIISLFTGILGVPPALGLGMIIDLIILIVGMITIYMIFKNGQSFSPAIGETSQPMPPTTPYKGLSAEPSENELSPPSNKEE
ncbi:MAG: hypothetical protein JSV09_10200 [Thermoplasmata archaeon]|nr:MAG: hypothetical protein JSV09_10200 [Thermoplasmata archaeon]